MPPPVRDLEGSKQKSFRGSTSLCPRGSNTLGFSSTFYLAVHDVADIATVIDIMAANARRQLLMDAEQ